MEGCRETDCFMKVEINNQIQDELSKSPWFIAGCSLPRGKFRNLVREKFKGPTRCKFVSNCMALYDRVQVARKFL